jgi:hypothetical protein
MAGEDQKPADAQQFQWFPSSTYRVIHSNFFRYRLNAGEMTLHFDSVTDLGPSVLTASLIGEISVAMSWPQIKALMRTLQLALEVIERDIGPIITPDIPEKAIDAEKERVAKLLRGLYLRAEPPQPT